MWTAAFVLVGALGVWLLVNPSGLVKLWTARRAATSDLDRYVGRLVGVLVLWSVAAPLVGHVKRRTLHSYMGWPLSLVMGGVTAFFAYKIVVSYVAYRRDGGKLLDSSQWRSSRVETRDEAETRYANAWKTYRRLRVATPLLFIGWPPFGVLIVSLFRFLRWNEYVAMAVVLGWIPLISVAGWRWSNWKCPRCGHTFKGAYSPFFEKRCHHCGLPMWAKSPEE